jgi:hypothetical protein
MFQPSLSVCALGERPLISGKETAFSTFSGTRKAVLNPNWYTPHTNTEFRTRFPKVKTDTQLHSHTFFISDKTQRAEISDAQFVMNRQTSEQLLALLLLIQYFCGSTLISHPNQQLRAVLSICEE